MYIVFSHDNKFCCIDNIYYSMSSLDEKLLLQYVDAFGKVKVIGRLVDEKSANMHLSKISHKDIIISKHSLLRDIIIVKNSKFLIARLPSVIGFYTMLIAIIYKKPYFVELVGCPWDTFWNYSLKGKIIAPFMWMLTKFAIRRAKDVLYVSKFFLQNRYPTSGRGVSCPDVILEIPQKHILLKRINRIKEISNRRTIILGLIGSLNVAYRGHEILLKSLNELNIIGIYCEVRFLGGGTSEQWKHVIESYHLEKQVHFSGAVESGEAVMNWIDNIDILVMPTKAETLGRAIIEAMSRGCPVIGSLETAIGEQIGSDCLCKAEDYKGLAKLIAHMIYDTEYMSYCAYENFYRSYKYTNEQTKKIRDQFYKEFLNENFERKKS